MIQLLAEEAPVVEPVPRRRGRIFSRLSQATSHAVLRLWLGLVAWVQGQWDALAAPATGKKVHGTLLVAGIAVVLGFLASCWAIRTGMNLAYYDAQLHLTIARRIVDSPSPGFQQLGTVWLPAPHLLLLPLTLNLWLWHTGWAGAILGIACLATSAAAIYRIAARIRLGRAARITAVAFFLCNPSILYIHTTALTEPVLLATMLATFAGLAHWITSKRKFSGGEVAVFIGLPASIGVLTRYEAWAMAFGVTLFMLWASWRKWGDIKYGIRMTLSFLALPFVAVLWWLSYNWTIYGDVLEFATSDYSAGAQQHDLYLRGLLPTQGNLGLSFYTFGWAEIETAGVVLLGIAFLGAAALVLKRGFAIDAMLVWLIGITLPFNIAMLFLGQTVIYNDHTLPIGWFNNRYALSTLPFLALLAAFFVDSVRNSERLSRYPRGRMVIIGVVAATLLLQNAWWLQDVGGRSGVIAEAAERDLYSGDERAADRYIADNYQGGHLLMDEVQLRSAPIIGLPMTEIYNRSAGKLYDQSLLEPSKNVEWIYITTDKSDAGLGLQDAVARTMAQHPERFTNYQEVFQNATRSVYRRVKQ